VQLTRAREPTTALHVATDFAQSIVAFSPQCALALTRASSKLAEHSLPGAVSEQLEAPAQTSEHPDMSAGQV